MVMLQQMIVMFLMMAVGYLCYRRQILTEEVSRKVSAIVVNVANPCMILSSALTDQQMQGKELVQTLAIVVMMYAFLLVVAQLLPRILCIQKESRGFCKHWLYGIPGTGCDVRQWSTFVWSGLSDSI